MWRKPVQLCGLRASPDCYKIQLGLKLARYETLSAGPSSQVEGITVEILAEALKHARTARRHILGEMERCMPAPRRALADNAPRIQLLTIDPEKVGFLIGPGGRNIRAITVESGAESVQVRLHSPLPQWLFLPLSTPYHVVIEPKQPCFP